MQKPRVIEILPYICMLNIYQPTYLQHRMLHHIFHPKLLSGCISDQWLTAVPKDLILVELHFRQHSLFYMTIWVNLTSRMINSFKKKKKKKTLRSYII